MNGECTRISRRHATGADCAGGAARKRTDSRASRFRDSASRIAPVFAGLFTLLAAATAAPAREPVVKKDIPYVDAASELQRLDVYAPRDARDLPVIFWIHGGGWQGGDKSQTHLKPKACVDRGYVFVSTNYRLLPAVEMGTIVRDVAKAMRWVQDHIAEYGGDHGRIIVTGHSAGAQLAALICTDEKYLKAEGVRLASLRGCVPVDGDTYDVPLMIETGRARRKAQGQPEPKFGHFEKFGSDPEKHRDFSAVNHVARDKGIVPFLLLHVADHPDVTAQAQRLGSVLSDAGIPARVYGAADTNHMKINENLGQADDPTSKVFFDFIAERGK